MIIRAYQPDDWQAVQTIYDLAKPDEMRGSVPPDAIRPLAEDAAMQQLFAASHILVAEVECQVAGFGGYSQDCIDWMFIHPEHRRQGLASALIIALLAQMGGQAILNVAQHNAAARRLYDRHGFLVEREFIGQYNGHPCGVLRLRYGSQS